MRFVLAATLSLVALSAYPTSSIAQSVRRGVSTPSASALFTRTPPRRTAADSGSSGAGSDGFRTGALIGASVMTGVTILGCAAGDTWGPHDFGSCAETAIVLALMGGLTGGLIGAGIGSL